MLMKRKRVTAIALVTVLLGGVVWAAVDLSDFNDDVMRAMDDANKELQPYISAGNVNAAIDDSQVLAEGLKWTEAYFADKGGAEDAVKFSQDGIKLNDEILQALKDRKLEVAGDKARQL